MQNSTFWGAFSMQKSQRSKWYINPNYDTPAPHTYNILCYPDKKQSPHYSIGYAERSTIADSKVGPGIGKYNIDMHDGFKKGVKIQGKYEQRSFLSNAGPNTYEVKIDYTKKAQPSYSFTIRQPEVWSKDTPAPNQYEQKQIDCYDKWRSKRNNGFTKQEKLKLNDNKTPGIGKYNIDNNKLKSKTPSYKFSQAKREIDQIDETIPGPGDFDCSYVKTEANKFTLGQKLNSTFTVVSKVPGPGAYNDSFSKNNKAISIGSGPDQYDVNNSFSYSSKNQNLNGYYFGLANRTQTVSPTIINNPGPGYYEQQTNNIKYRNPSFFIQEKRKLQKNLILENPGPSNYEPKSQSIYQQHPSHQIGKSKRHNPIRNYYKCGPGSYNLQNFYSQTNKCSIGNQQRFNKYDKNVPGVGQYNLQGDISKLPRYLVKKKIQSNCSNKTGQASIQETQKEENQTQQLEVIRSSVEQTQRIESQIQNEENENENKNEQNA